MKSRNIMQFLSAAMNAVVRLLFACIIIYLTLLAGFSTTAVSTNEHVFLLQDNIFINLGIEAGFLCLLLLLSRQRNLRSIFEEKSASTRKALLWIAFILAMLLVLLTQKLPNADQRQVYETVQSILDHDSTPFEPGGYLEMYPYQSGMIYFSYLLAKLFGTHNYMLFQCMNAVCFIWILHSLSDIADLVGWKPAAGTGTIILSILFVPFLLYVNFIYGTMSGLALTVAAFKDTLLLRTSEKGKRWLYSIRPVLFMLAAVMIKTNYMVYLIGLIIYLIREWFRTQKGRFVPLAIAMIVVLAVNSSLAHSLIEHASGQKLTKGVNSLAWIAMGISENEEKFHGWWNGYTNQSYRANGFDYDAQGEAVKAEISRRIRDFSKNPRKALKFFAGKNASQWNNPDFQSFNFSQFMIDNEHMVPVRLVYKIFTVEWSARIHDVLNYVQFIILFGALLFVLLSDGKDDSAFFYEIVVIGGMIFHTIWEGKSQYTFTYFLFFLPIAAKGYQLFIRETASLASERRMTKRKPVILSAILLVSLCVIATGRFSFINNIFMPSNIVGDYETYLASNRFVRISDGTYTISPSVKPHAYLSDLGTNAQASILTGDAIPLHLRFKDTTDTFILKAQHGTLASPGEYPQDNQSVYFLQDDDSRDYRWQLIKGEHTDEFYILFRDNYALTIDPDTDTICLQEFTFDDTQAWILHPV